MHFNHRGLKLLTLAMTLILTFALSISMTGCGQTSNGPTTTGSSPATSETANPAKEFKIGTQGYAEVEILAEIFKALVEDQTQHTITHVRSLGSSTAGFEATRSNDLQMFTSFTGTLFLGLLEQELTDENRDPDIVFTKTRNLLSEKYQLYAAAPYGYNNTYAIAVPRAWAEANQVTKQSDLSAFAADMKLAVDQTWLTYPGQGYEEYVKHYGFSFKETVAMDLGLIYQAIAQKEVDAVNVYSTDGQLVAQDLLVLEDDRAFNPPYNGILVLREDVVNQYPEIKKVADSLEGTISTEKMQDLNKQVSVDQKEPAVVAMEFLKESGLLG